MAFKILAAVVVGIAILIGLRMRNINLPARVAWGEARNQGPEGMQAVLNTMKNRSDKDLWNDGKDDWWGEGLANVATKPSQYSAYNDNDPNRALLDAVTSDDPNFALAVELSARNVRGDLPDITNGATHYHTRFINPPFWAATATVSAYIGDHIFYSGVS